MKLPESNISAETHNVVKESNFAIGNIGLVIEILRSKLYRDPAYAIVREYANNARDAHREMKTPDVPIKIYLPNAFDSNLKIQDFGPGITPDRMENVFLKYGESTKRDDNTQTGAFGIGCKSCFAYSDTFSIISITDKTRRLYTAYIDETKIGKLALVEEKPTTEANGTTIICPVKRKDFQQFIDSTIKAVEYWPVKPELLGLTPTPTFPKKNLLFSGSNWSLMESYWGAKPIVLSDDTPYELTEDSLGNLSAELRNFINFPFVYRFKTGEISLSASRDSIHFDEKTQKIIIQRLRDVGKELKNTFDAKIAACTSYLEAVELYQETIRSYPAIKDLLKCQWNGKEIKFKVALDDIGSFAKLAVHPKIKHKYDYFDNLNLTVNKKYQTIINDKTSERLSSSIIERLQQHFPDATHLQIISTPEIPTSAEYLRLVELKKTPDVKYDLAWAELIGGIKFSDIKLAEVIKAPRKAKAAKQISKVEAYTITASSWVLGHQAIQVDDVGGVYIVVDYSINKYFSGELNFNNNPDIFRTVQKFLGDDNKILGFTPTRAAKLSKAWIPLEAVLETKCQEIFTKEITLEKLIDANAAANENCLFKSNFSKAYHEYNFESKITDTTSILKKYILESKVLEDIIDSKKDLFDILKFTGKIGKYNGYDYGNKKLQCSLHRLKNDVNKKYPLLKLINNAWSDDMPKILDYITLIDEKVVVPVGPTETKPKGKSK